MGLALLAIVTCLPVLRSGGLLGYWDWDVFQANFELARSTLLDYGQLPGWNPYMRGGGNLLANPILSLSGPSMLFVLLFGTIPGLKIWILVRQFVALVGGYLLGRRLGYGQLAAFTVAAAFGLSSCYAQRVGHGHWNLQAVVYLPLVAYAALGAIETRSWRARAGAALWLALAFLDGGPYSVAVAGLGLVPAAAVAIARGHARRALPGLAAIALLAASLAAVKAVPVSEAYADGARDTRYAASSESGHTPDFYRRNFHVSAADFVYAALLDRNQASQPGRFETFHSNVGAYLGPLGLVLALLGALLGGATGRSAWLFALPVFWLCLGSSAPLNLWAIVHQLPVASSMQVPSKFSAAYLLALAVAAGAGVNALEKRLGGSRIRHGLLTALVAAFALDLLLVSRPLFEQAFPIEPISVEAGAFHQQMYSPFDERYALGVTQSGLAERPYRHGLYTISSVYPAVRANFGVLQTHDGASAVTPIYAEADPAGRLQVWQVVADVAEPLRLDYWSPNELRVSVEPGHAGLLVVNQNHHPGWRARGAGRRLDVAPAPDGRLAVQLPADVAQVTLHFEWAPARIGAAVSALALAACIALIARRPSANPR